MNIPRPPTDAELQAIVTTAVEAEVVKRKEEKEQADEKRVKADKKTKKGDGVSQKELEGDKESKKGKGKVGNRLANLVGKK